MKLTAFLFAVAALLLASMQAAPLRISQFVGLNTGNLGNDAATGQREQWFLVGNAGAITTANGSGSLDGRGIGLVESAGDRVFISSNNQINTSRNQFAANGSFPQSAGRISIIRSFTGSTMPRMWVTPILPAKRSYV